MKTIKNLNRDAFLFLKECENFSVGIDSRKICRFSKSKMKFKDFKFFLALKRDH